MNGCKVLCSSLPVRIFNWRGEGQGHEGGGAVAMRGEGRSGHERGGAVAMRGEGRSGRERGGTKQP